MFARTVLATRWAEDAAMIATYQALCPQQVWHYLDEAGVVTGQAERALAAALKRGGHLNDLKRDYQLRFGINARQFNAIRIGLDGKLRAAEVSHQLHLKT